MLNVKVVVAASRGLLRDCTTSPINRFAALLQTLNLKHKRLCPAFICLCSGQHIPRPVGTEEGHGEVVDPYVEVSFAGENIYCYQ